MSDRDLEFAYPSDDLSRSVTATLTSGTQATGYEPVKLTNDDPSYPFKVDTTTFRLLWDFGSAKTVDYVLLVHHNLIAGLTGVTFAMGSTTATSDFSRDFTIRSWFEDGFPRNEHLDLRDANPTYRYASLAVTNANSVACAIGKVPILTTVRSVDGAIEIEAEEDEDHPLVEHATDVGVTTIYAFGTRLRWLRGTKTQLATDASAMRSLYRATQGRSLPFVLIPHLIDDTLLASSPSVVTEESWLVRFEDTKLPRTYLTPDFISKYDLKFQEVARGLAPTPSPY